MLKAEQIPDEVVEAAARVIASVNEPIDKWIYHTPESCAAIAAALSAWPGAVWHPQGQWRKKHGVTHLILPLPRADQKEGE